MIDSVIEQSFGAWELIVIDDGSTDATAALASRYDVRLARTPNRGLSRARNTGIDMATGEIVAFIDGDARPDPHWLHYLAHAFATSDFVGVGGPNIQPEGDPWAAECVAAAPGGPIHVLSSDRVAEHIPGCNMAFRRRALVDVGGFDPRYRVAGDDVDLCWRLQERGWTLGFHAGAMVWHHHRDSVGAFWRQQRGYGRAEALLEARWPDKYNSAGHVTWGGRVYGRGVPFFRRSRVYHGTWGAAPFQPLHTEAPGLVASLSTTPEWFLLIGILAAVSAAGLLWPPLLLGIPLLVFAIASVVLQATRRSAALTRRRGGPLAARLRFGAITFALHLLQPLARLVGRVGAGLTPWRLNHGPGYPLPFGRTETAWTEGWTDPRTRLAALESALRRTGERVRRGGPYADWDLDVHHGPTGRARVRMAVEEHGSGRQLWRFRIQPRMARVSALLAGAFGALGVWALADGATGLSMLLVGGAVLVVGRTVVEAAASTAAALGAIRGETL